MTCEYNNVWMNEWRYDGDCYKMLLIIIIFLSRFGEKVS